MAVLDAPADLAERICGVLRLRSESLALDAGERGWSWNALDRARQRLSGVLSGAGLEAGAPVALVMRNTPETVVAALAVLGHRQALVTLNPHLPPDRLAQDVARLDVAAVLADAAAWEAGGLEEVAVAGNALGVVLDPEPIIRAPGPVRATGRTRPGVAIEMLTSGTTGTPKRVPLSHAGLGRSFERFARQVGADPRTPRLQDDVAIIAQPLVHIGGLWMLLLNLLCGRPVALLERFAVEAWVALVRRHRPTSAPLPPAALQMVLDAGVPREDLASLRSLIVGAAPVRAELAERFEAAYGIPVLVSYGATEFGGGVAGWTLELHRQWSAHKRGSVGRAQDGVALRTVDPATGAVLGPDEVGLLEVRAAQFGHDRWVRSTDRASIDPDGFLWLHGRADAVIVRGGFKVQPEEVVAVLEGHSAVREAAVVARDDPRLGEVPVAFVEPVGGAVVAPEDLLAWSRAALVPYQVPVEVIVVDALPRTPSSKVSLAALRQRLREGSP